MYQGFFSGKQPLKWQEHLNWWLSRNKGWKQFIVVLMEDDIMRDVGVVTMSELENWDAEIGFYIGEVSLWGQGIGKEAVRQGLEWLRHKGYERVHTTVLKNNKRARSLLDNLGFTYTCEAREGEIRVDKNIKER